MGETEVTVVIWAGRGKKEDNLEKRSHEICVREGCTHAGKSVNGRDWSMKRLKND